MQQKTAALRREGYFVTATSIIYLPEGSTFSIIGENLLDTEWNEAQLLRNRG